MTSDFELMPCGPDAVLPAQVAGGVCWDADTSGARALMLAVLEDAVLCIERGRWQRRFGARRLAAEAEAWVRCDRADWPFSSSTSARRSGSTWTPCAAGSWRSHPGANDHAGRKETSPSPRAKRVPMGDPERREVTRNEGTRCSTGVTRNKEVHHNTRKETDR